MKKLMLTAALMCAAVVGQAANLKWGTGAIKGLDGTTSVGDGATGYIFTLTDEQYDFIAGLATAGTTEKINEAMATLYGGFKKSDTASTLMVNGTAATLLTNAKTSGASTSKITSGNVAEAASTRYNAAMIILYSEDDKDYYKANIGTFTSAASPSAKTFGDMELKWLGENGTTAISWQAVAVPEPFSGALALLGMGAIALRRKMKKAKKA